MLPTARLHDPAWLALHNFRAQECLKGLRGKSAQERFRWARVRDSTPAARIEKEAKLSEPKDAGTPSAHHALRR